MELRCCASHRLISKPFIWLVLHLFIHFNLDRMENASNLDLMEHFHVGSSSMSEDLLILILIIHKVEQKDV